MKKIDKWVNRILNIDIVLACICMLILVLLTFVGALMRYFLRSPIYWQEEVQQWMIMWTIFFGSSFAFRKGSHVSVEVLTDSFPEKYQKYVTIFGYLCTLIALTFFFRQSLALISQYIRTNKRTTVLRMHSWIVYIIAPIGTVWMAISATYYMIKEVFFKKAALETEQGEEPKA